MSVYKVTAFDRSDGRGTSNVGMSSTFIQAVSEERSTESRVHSYRYPWICSFQQGEKRETNEAYVGFC